MEVINLSSRSFKGLRTLELPNTVYNTEGKIYIYEDKDKWNKRMHLVKRLYINSGPIFSNKLATINSLVDYEEQIDMPFCSKYLSRMNPSISDLPGKYKLSNFRCSGDIIPNKDTDLYCYIITVLNTLFGRETHRLPLETFYDYLEYLRRIGVSTELIDIISDIYSNKSNTNPKELLDGLKPVFYKCHESVFKSLTKQRRCQ